MSLRGLQHIIQFKIASNKNNKSRRLVDRTTRNVSAWRGNEMQQCHSNSPISPKLPMHSNIGVFEKASGI